MSHIVIIPLLILCSVMSAGSAVSSDGEVSALDSFTGAFTEGKFYGTLRSLLFSRQFDGSTIDRSTLAVGGNLKYETAPFYGVSAGVGVKTGLGDTLNHDEVYRDVLAIGDTYFDAEGYFAVDEYYLRYTNWNTDFSLGAQGVETPWLNVHDIRLTPKKYRGVGVINKSIENLVLHGYYISDWLTWTADSWESISSGITGNQDDDEGALIVGGVWQMPDKLKFQAWNYYFHEVLNSFYLVGDYQYNLSDEYALTATLAYLNQTDVGAALAGDVTTYTVGGNISIAAYGAKLTGFYGRNGNDALRTPFGGSWVVSFQVNNLERADEQAWALQLEYDFKSAGLPGLSTYVSYSRFDTPDTGVTSSPDFTETDFNLQYTLGGRFKKCSIRLRYALIDQDEDVESGEDYSDGRLYLQYRF